MIGDGSLGCRITSQQRTSLAENTTLPQDLDLEGEALAYEVRSPGAVVRHFSFARLLIHAVVVGIRAPTLVRGRERDRVPV